MREKELTNYEKLSLLVLMINDFPFVTVFHFLTQRKLVQK